MRNIKSCHDHVPVQLYLLYIYWIVLILGSQLYEFLFKKYYMHSSVLFFKEKANVSCNLVNTHFPTSINIITTHVCLHIIKVTLSMQFNNTMNLNIFCILVI